MTLSTKPGKRLPYYTTKVPAMRTRLEIEQMLYNYGASATRWTTTEDDMVGLEFEWKVETPDGLQPMMFRILPPILLKKDGTPHMDWSMRVLFWWLKSKLESVYFDLRSVVEEFLPQVVAHIGPGKKATVGEVFIPQILSGNVVEPGSLAQALGPPKEEDED